MSCFTQNTYKEFPVTNEKKGHFYSIPDLGKELGLDLSRLASLHPYCSRVRTSQL